MPCVDPGTFLHFLGYAVSSGQTRRKAAGACKGGGTGLMAG